MSQRPTSTFLACTTIAILLAGGASALPPSFPSGASPQDPHLGPVSANACTSTQAYGWGGDADGTTTDYHRYANDQAIGFLDACLGDAGASEYVECKVEETEGRVLPGLNEVVAGAATLDLARIQGGADDVFDSLLLWSFCDEAGLEVGSTDGEYEYASGGAALNVREGSFGAGAGVTGCIGPLATAHHADDTTVHVLDAIAGGSVGFTVSADWGRNGEDCGDNAIEPCPGDVILLLQFTCNPLDASHHVDPLPLGSAGPNSWSSGASLSSFGNGGASGYLYVFLDGVGAQTAGWVWTGL